MTVTVHALFLHIFTVQQTNIAPGPNKEDYLIN